MKGEAVLMGTGGPVLWWSKRDAGRLEGISQLPPKDT